MNKIHNTAIIGKNTTIGSNVEIGPYCVVEDGVKIGNDNTLHASVYMSGETDIGNGNTFFPFCSIGSMPQDLKYQGEKSKLIIGDENIFREYSTANPGTSGDNMKTVIGNLSLFMIGAHIAHDCIIGDKVIMANQATLGGHVVIENNAVIGGLSVGTPGTLALMFDAQKKWGNQNWENLFDEAIFLSKKGFKVSISPLICFSNLFSCFLVNLFTVT